MSDINKSVEDAEKFIKDLVEMFRKGRWVKVLLFIAVIFVVLLNPASVKYGLNFFGFEEPAFYSNLVWGIIVGALFITAFLVAFFTQEEKIVEQQTHKSIIKGLLPYTKEDAEWFAKLQRGNILQECFRFITEKSLRFAILSGESGAGKTSFLQAGLLPALENQGYRSVYVKFTNNPPLDTICQSIANSFAIKPLKDEPDLSELIKSALDSDNLQLVLLLDQFEQFFAHHKTKGSRKHFVRQLTKFYLECESLPVKIIVSIRGDFVNRLSEFQHEMEYTLTLHNNLYLEKFEPEEAMNIINVIGREAKIELDEKFVKEFTKDELVDDEGKISPVDIQILSWMIDGQKNSEERAFNRRAFQKLGGIEGLLKRFLNRALKSIQADLRQSAVNVMLALTEGNVRAGALSPAILEKKLEGTTSPGDIRKAVKWLASPEVRLVTEIAENNIILYELAHERIIAPLRQSFREIEDVETAELTLDRRFNEWIGNNRARRYLLRFREWRLINRYWKLMTIGLRKEEKTEFLSLSKRRFINIGLGLVVILFFGLSGLGGYKIYERRPETQMHYAQNHLIDLLEKKKGTDGIREATLLLASIDQEKERALHDKIWQSIKKLDSPQQFRVLPTLEEAHLALGNHQEALRILEQGKILRNDKEVRDFHLAMTLPSMAEAYIKFANKSEALLILENLKNLQESKILNPVSRGCLLPSMAQINNKLSDHQEALNILQEGLNASKNLDSPQKLSLLVSLGKTYSSLPENDAVLNGLNKIDEEVKNPGLNRPLGFQAQADIWASQAEEYSKLSDTNKALEELGKKLQAIEQIGPDYQVDALVSITKTYGKFSGNGHALEKLDRILSVAGELDSEDKAFVWSALAESYTKHTDVKIVYEKLDNLQKLTEGLNPTHRAFVLVSLAEAYNNLADTQSAIKLLNRAEEKAYEAAYKNLVLSKIAVLYAKIRNWEKSRETVLKIGNETDAIKALSKILIIWKDVKNGTKKMEILEKIPMLPGNGCEDYLSLDKRVNLQDSYSP